MKVRATRFGFYDHKKKKEGAVFHIKSEQEFSEKWMEKLDGKKKPARKKPVVKEESVDLNKDLI